MLEAELPVVVVQQVLVAVTIGLPLVEVVLGFQQVEPYSSQ